MRVNSAIVQAIVMLSDEYPDASVSELADAVNHGIDEGAEDEPSTLAGFAHNWMRGDAPDSPFHPDNKHD